MEKNIHPDVEYLLEKELYDTFTEEFLKKRVHTVDDDSFFFIAEGEDQKKMIKILSDTEDIQEIFKCKILLSYEDVTEDVFQNIDKYSKIPNIYEEGKNTFLDCYLEIFSPDAVLDKILEKGIDSLNPVDKEILENSVK